MYDVFTVIVMNLHRDVLDVSVRSNSYRFNMCGYLIAVLTVKYLSTDYIGLVGKRVSAFSTIRKLL